MRHRHKKLWATTLICTFFLPHLTLANPVLVPQFLSEGGRNMRYLPCVSRRTGETGVCMFAFTCAKANGTHLGTCIDRFYFGSCCKLDDESNIPNAIGDNFNLGLIKPLTMTTTPHGLESNLIPDNIDPISKPAGTRFPVQGSTLITKAPESTTMKTIDQTKTKPVKGASKKPGVISTTTESIRLSTFQTVQTGSEQKTSTTPEIISSKWPQSSSAATFTSESQEPTQSTHFGSTFTEMTTRYPTRPSSMSTSMTSSSPLSTYSRPHSSLPPSTLPFGHRNVTSKRPGSTTYGTRRPITTQEFTDDPDTVGTTIYTYGPSSTVDSNDISHSSTHTLSSLHHSRPTPSFSTTQRVPSVTRFPPRNTTTAIPTFGTKLTSILNSTSVSASTSSTSMSTSTSTSTTLTVPSTNATSAASQGVEKPTTTRKPLKKPTKLTTKRPAATRKPGSSTAIRQPSTSNSSAQSSFITTTPISTYAVLSVIPLRNYTYSGSKRPSPTASTATISSSAASSSSPSSTTSVTTKTPSSSTAERPVSGSTGTKVTTPSKRPSTTTPKKNATTTAETRPTTTTSFSKFTATTKKPVITTIPLSPETTRPTTPDAINKYTTQKLCNSTTVSPITTREPIEYNVVTEATVVTSAAVTVKTTAPPTTTTARPVSLTSPVTQASITRPAFQSRPSSPSTSIFTNKKNVTSWSRPTTTTESNEIDTELESELDTTTATPGFVTWSSFSTETENPTKTLEYSSIVPAKPVSEFTTMRPAVSFTTSPPTTTTTTTTTTTPKPTTRRTTTTTTTTTTTPTPTTTTTTTTFQSTTQASTYVDTLSTIATVTVSPEFTEATLPPINISNFREVCGRRLYSEPRIVNGTPSSFGKWPWQISLRQWRTSTYLHKCGAALLNENWAITAAHCVQNVLPGDLLLRIGEHDLSHEEEPYGFQERRVQIVASHPSFDPRTFEFDLALMRFYEPVLPFQPNILPVCVPDDDEDYVGQQAVVTGWGRLYEEGPLPPVLQEVSVPVINNTACEGMYRNAGYIEHIPHIFICAGWRKGGFDSCEGDSGGPLVVQRKRDNRWVLAGVISWGIGCAEPNQPGVYTRISEFREWINQILQF